MDNKNDQTPALVRLKEIRFQIFHNICDLTKIACISKQVYRINEWNSTLLFLLMECCNDNTLETELLNKIQTRTCKSYKKAQPSLKVAGRKNTLL